jgi:hypothetical protein
MASMNRITRFALWAGSLLLAAIANAIAPISILAGGTRGWGVVQANDEALNAALGGSARQYLSTRCAIANRDGKWWGRLACRIFNIFAPGHCAEMLNESEMLNE